MSSGFSEGSNEWAFPGGAGGPLINYFEAPPISPISPILPNHVTNNGPKKITENNVVCIILLFKSVSHIFYFF
jgi:hypothetical protein